MSRTGVVSAYSGLGEELVGGSRKLWAAASTAGSSAAARNAVAAAFHNLEGSPGAVSAQVEVDCSPLPA